MEYEDPMVVVIALSLYAYNVSPMERAAKLHEYFDGNCMELADVKNDLMSLLAGHRGECLATELPFPTAQAYVQHALAMYRDEAIDRVRLNDRTVRSERRSRMLNLKE